MIRWKYFVPRLVLLGLCAVFLLIAINPVVRWSIVRSGHAVTGARVDVDRIRTNLWESSVKISGFRAADPQRPMRNLFDMNDIRMTIDSRALVRRRIVVKQAEITGLNLDTDRTISGALTEENSRALRSRVSRTTPGTSSTAPSSPRLRPGAHSLSRWKTCPECSPWRGETSRSRWRRISRTAATPSATRC